MASAGGRVAALAEDVRSGARFFAGALRVLRRPTNAAEVHSAIRQRLELRQERFLALARDAIYSHPPSPYRSLLALAGCEYGDLERLVRQEDVEGALSALFRRGVYLTTDEVKGRAPITRGSTTVDLLPGALHDPRVRADIVNRTSGSRSSGTAVPLSFSSLRDRAMDNFLELEAAGGLGWAHAYWSVPGGSLVIVHTQHLVAGVPLVRWFALVDPRLAGLHPRYAWSAQALRLATRVAGGRFPRTTHVSFQDPRPIARWMADVLHSGRTPYLRGHTSALVHLCRIAADDGINLRGAQFYASGESMTAARLRAFHGMGAAVRVNYGNLESGSLGTSCLAPKAPDDVHFRHDRLALIQPGDDAMPALPAQALLVTSLMSQARLILLNTSLGDQAVHVQRACGCALERVGLSRHLHSIRSFEKLTAGGTTFFDTDVVRVLEETLPERFGGGPGDYQLVDEELPDGRPGVRLLAHPRLGPLDATDVRRVFLAQIGQDAGAERIMAQVWDDAGLPVVERTAPRATPGGKVQHIHRDQGQSKERGAVSLPDLYTIKPK